MPKGIVGASTATAMPVKPNPGENPSINLPYFSQHFGDARKPGSMPLSAMTPMVVAAMLMPADAAAFDFRRRRGC
jgi:hypothetical protein